MPTLETSRTGVDMRRTFSVCAALGALSLVASPQARAQDARDVRGTYAFTLAESCVQQDNFAAPGFDSNFRLTDTGAMTYGGASNGFIVFDGKGKVSFLQAKATNLFNAPGFLSTGAIPLGFGLGPALPFTCQGTYDVAEGKIAILSLDVTCTATILTTNPGNPIAPNTFTTGFLSTFNMKGGISRNPTQLALTDIGDAIQLVTILVQDGSGKSLPNLVADRICTRSTTANLVSKSTSVDIDPQ